MNFAVGNPLEQLGISLFGSLWAFAVFILIVILILMFIAGFDPTIAILLCMPLVYAFGKAGWWPSGISYIIFLVVVAWAGYFFYQKFFRDY